MKIPLDRQAKKPVYLQIRDRIQHLIHTGHLSPDTQLPSIRTLAQTVKVNKLTVLEAYSALEADGLVRAKQGAGYFINPPNLRAPLTPAPLLPSTFNPAQEVLIPRHGITSFTESYPPNVTWTVPNGGTFLWIQLPDKISLGDVCTAAAEQKILVGSGAAFFPTQQGYPAMRLNFSLSPEQTERGVQILGSILRTV
ncbi:hypothetical protein BH23CYA1_BH23CYA1_04030 [soil metagenome]